MEKYRFTFTAFITTSDGEKFEKFKASIIGSNFDDASEKLSAIVGESFGSERDGLISVEELE